MQEKKFIIHHIEELGGTIGTIIYVTIVRWQGILLKINYHEIWEHLVNETPLFLASGFFGGLGGHMVRMIFQHFEKRRREKRNEQID
jgi:H+/Cl- antiporter ClcA